MRNDPTVLGILKAHYLRWVIFTIKGERDLMYQGIFDTDFDKYCKDPLFLFGQDGHQAMFEALEGWPEDYATNPTAIVVRDHRCSSNTASIPTKKRKGLRQAASPRWCSTRMLGVFFCRFVS